MSDNPFDLNKYAEELRKTLQEKIRCDLATLMPEGVWLEHIKKEVEAFVRADAHGDSPLRTMVLEQLRPKAAEMIKSELASQGVFAWMPTPAMVSEIVKDCIKENMESLMIAVFGKALQDQIAQTLQNLPSGGFR